MDGIRIKTVLVIIVVLLNVTCFASEIGVIIDDKNIEFDVPPTSQNGRVLVPMRKIFEELGCTVEWLGESQTIIATQNSKVIALRLGNNKIICTDIETGVTEVKKSDVPPTSQNGRTLVPVRVISEILGCFVGWNGENNSVIIKSK